MSEDMELKEYREGVQDGVTWADHTGMKWQDLKLVPDVEGTDPYRAGFRVGVGRIRQSRFNAEQSRAN